MEHFYPSNNYHFLGCKTKYSDLYCTILAKNTIHKRKIIYANLKPQIQKKAEAIYSAFYSAD